MDEQPIDKNEKDSPVAIIATIVVAGLVIVGIMGIIANSSQSPTIQPSSPTSSSTQSVVTPIFAPQTTPTAPQTVSSPSTPTQNNAPPTQSTSAFSEHASDYIYAYLSALSYLYQSTQSYAQVQSLLGSSGDESNSITAVLTSLDQSITDLQDASAAISPYINDNDEAIEAISKLLYADTVTELNAADQMQSSLTYAVQNQDASALQDAETEMASFASDKLTLQNDLPQGIQVVKYIIENPTNDQNPTGPIDYAISPSNRAFLRQQMRLLFPVPLDQAADQSSVYLLYAHTISIFLSANTYEQQSADSTQI